MRILVVAPLAAVALLPAQNLGDYCVDGIRGRDVPEGGTAANPWKTITYAVARIPPVTSAGSWNTLFVEGNQVYSAASNGETLPISPAYNLWIEGKFVGHGQMPVLRASAGGTAVRYDPAIVYSRNQSTLRYLVFEGGDYGVAMGNSGANRHRPRIQDCVFSNQARAGARIDPAGPESGIDPRFFQTTFTGGKRGIEIFAAADGAVVHPDVEECTFRGLTDLGIYLDDTSSGGTVGGSFTSSWFSACPRGIWVNSHARATRTSFRVASSSFRDIAYEALLVVVNDVASSDARVERTSFLRCGDGVRFGGNPAARTVQCALSVSDSTFDACSSVGLRIDLYNTGACTLTSRDNLFTHCAGSGMALGPAPGIELRVSSLRDRMLHNFGGVQIGHGGSASAVSFESALLCGNTLLGFSALAPFVGRGLTFADNGVGLNALNSGNLAVLDHCVFAGNGTNLQAAPAITWSCFQGSSYGGTGNLNDTDPLLVRPFYKLAPSSPCIDRGNAALTLPATDYEGDPRASVGRANGQPIPDLGADEYVYAGSARKYGTPGFGWFNFFPAISSPNARVVVGGPLTIALSGAILPFVAVPARDAFLTLGLRDDSGGLPIDLGVLGAPGSLLWNEIHAVVGLLPVTALGTASLTFGVPGTSLLAGQTFTFQWFANQYSANPSAPVASDGLRVTVGQ